MEQFAFASNFPFEFSSAQCQWTSTEVGEEPEGAIVPQLKHLTLTCPNLRGGGLFELVERLEEAGLWIGLEDVRFVGCDRLTPREIYKIVDVKEKRVEIMD